MRPLSLTFAALLTAALAPAQSTTPDSTYAPLTKAYEALRARDYDTAIAGFTNAVRLAPARADVRKDLAYTYLKIGENDLARDQFGEAMRLNPADTHVALEFAFLCFEAQDRISHGEALTWKATARRIFDHIRAAASGDERATAERAFQNIDKPLAAGIDRWKQALALGSESFSAHFELAELAEQRDELDLAAEHYRAAWKLQPTRMNVLLDVGRVLLRLNKKEDAYAALLAASRGPEPRASELAREMLPDRYPYVYEFRRALEVDPKNIALHRELAYLLLEMKDPGATQEFEAIVALTPEDLTSVAQLGFLYLKSDPARATPLLQHVIDGTDEDLANRARAALHIPTRLRREVETQSDDPRTMAEKSLNAGYLRDAVKYLKIVHEADPEDATVMLHLGNAYNMLHEDAAAVRWFALARKSDDPAVAAAANKSYKALWPGLERFRTTLWTFPMFSTRWHDVFDYSQLKTDMRLDRYKWFRPYVSLRFVGDIRGTIKDPISGPESLSESAFIVAAGASTKTWHNAFAWGEAGSAIGYLSHHMLPDYRGGVAWTRARGAGLGSTERGFFYETNEDAVYVHRFGKDTLGYSQNRAGFTPATPLIQTQFFWTFNITADLKHQQWANFTETGPGFRLHLAGTPPSMTLTLNALKGNYLIPGNPHGDTFHDIRVGLWYARTH